MKKKKILLVLGGASKERKISLKSGIACYKALKNLGHSVQKFDPLKEDLASIRKKKYNAIFNALHGKGGEDGVIQTFFEFLKVPYTHSGIISSFNSMNKILSKKIFIKNKILTPKYFLLNKSNFCKRNLKKLIKKNKIGYPIVSKPINEGSSIGVKICMNFKSLYNHSKTLLKKYDDIINESYIGGQEIQVAIINNKAIGAIELRPKRKFYDYKAKYLKSAKTEHIMPANLTKKNYNKVLGIAKKTHLALKCRGVTRCDFKFWENKFYLLELNTQPGMTNLSLVPEIAKYNNITFNRLIQKILADADVNK